MKQILQFLEVSSCDMEKGHLRCDANVSVRLKGAEKFGTKAEVKNLNSFRFLKLALDYEILRQVANHRERRQDRAGNAAVQRRIPARRSACAARSTRTITGISPSRIWSPCGSASVAARNHARHAGASGGRSGRDSSKSFGLREYDAKVLTQTRAHQRLLRKGGNAAGDAQTAANWVMGDLAAALKADNKDSPIRP